MVLWIYPVKLTIADSHPLSINLLIPFPVFPCVGCELLHVGFSVIQVVSVSALTTPPTPNTFNLAGIYDRFLAFPTLKSFARDCHDVYIITMFPEFKWFYLRLVF